jgi:hypothetical protein
MRYVSGNLLILAILILFVVGQAQATPGTTTFQMKIIKPDGVGLDAASVNFQFTTLASTGTCVLYVEQFNGISMAGSGGLAVLNLGSGTQVYSGYGTAYTDIFNNSSKLMNCQGSGGYLSVTSDRRRLVVQFNDGSPAGWQTLPVIDINSVPFSNFAGDTEKFGGKIPTDFILSSKLPGAPCSGAQVLTYSAGAFSCVSVAGTGTVTNVTSANSFVSIATGTTTPVITANVGTVANTLAAGNDTRLIGAAQKSNNLSDLTSVVTARTNLGLGTAAVLDAGAAAANLVQLDGGAKIPIALLPNIPASQITSGVIAPAQLGTGTADATTYLRGDGTWAAASGLGYVAKAGDTMTGPLVNNSNSASTALTITQSGVGKAATFMGGFVGVGTTTPAASLDVVGKDVTTGSAANAFSVVGGSTTDNGAGGNGGSVSIQAGNSTNWGNGGSSIFKAGAGYNFGGDTLVQAGYGTGSGLGHGGTLFLIGGGGTSVGGGVTISSGTMAGQQTAGNISITANGGTTTGGSISLAAGAGTSTTGGSVTIDAAAGGITNGAVQIGSANAMNTLIANGGGKVGIGTATPSAKLEVQGQIISKPFDNGSATTFNLANGNAQYTTASCGAMTLQNMVDGGSYTIAVQGATSGTCTFTDSAGGRTFRFFPANAPTTASTHAIYSMQVMGTNIYVSWITGF